MSETDPNSDITPDVRVEVSRVNASGSIGWKCQSRSRRLDVGHADHLGPLVSFVGNEFAELGRRHRHWHASQIGEPHLHLGIGKAGIYLPVDLVDDLGRRSFWRADPVPRAGLVARDKL